MLLALTLRSCLQAVEGGEGFNIKAIVSDLRMARNFMVQTFVQYAFVYRTVLDRLRNMLSEVTRRHVAGECSRRTGGRRDPAPRGHRAGAGCRAGRGTGEARSAGLLHHTHAALHHTLQARALALEQRNKAAKAREVEVAEERAREAAEVQAREAAAAAAAAAEQALSQQTQAVRRKCELPLV